MMIFLGGEYENSGMSPEEMGQKMALWNKWVEGLKKDDLFINGRALQNKKRHVAEEGQMVTDGPFVETKELVTGYFLIKARDFDHATSLTDGYPDYDLGGKVEIREIQNFE